MRLLQELNAVRRDEALERASLGEAPAGGVPTAQGARVAARASQHMLQARVCRFLCLVDRGAHVATRLVQELAQARRAVPWARGAQLIELILRRNSEPVG